jgi:hypothetical protein
MTKPSTIIVSLILLLPVCRSFSQSLNGAQLKEVNQALLEKIDDYERYSRFTTDNMKINESYISLFADLFDDNAQLYNDIVPSNKVSDPLGVTQYLNTLMNYYPTGVGVRLHNILFDRPSYQGNDRYEVNAELSKEIYGYTNTKVYYRDTIPLLIKLGFGISGNNITDIKILGISGEQRGRFLKLRVLKFLTLRPVENSRIRIDSKITHTDFQGIARIDDIDPIKRHNLIISHDTYKPIVYPKIDIDEFIDGNTVSKHNRLRLKYYDQNEFIFFMNTLNYSIAPVLSFGVPGLKTIASGGQTSELEFENLRERGRISPRLGMRFGVILLKTSSMDLSLNTGIEKNYIRAAYMFDTCRIEIFPAQSTEVTDFYSFKQKITLNFTDFPLSLSLDYKKIKNFEIGAIFGVRFSNLKKSYSTVRSGYAANGMYEAADTLTTKYHNFHSESKLVSFQVGLNISKEIMPSVKVYAGPSVFFYNKNWLENEIVSSEMLSSDLRVNNILNTYSDSKVQYVGLEFGIQYNFNTIRLKKAL